MHINLTPTLDEYVLSKVKSGRYNNASEVVREALRRMQDEEARHQAMPNFTSTDIEEIRAGIEQGIEEIERGEGKDYEGEEGLKQLFKEIRAQGLKELNAERRKRARR